MISFAFILLIVTTCNIRACTDPSIKLINIIGERTPDASNYELQIPTDIVLGANDQIYIIDAGSHRILSFDIRGKLLAQFGKKGAGPSEFYYPYSIDMDSRDNIFISDLGNDRIQLFDLNGTYQGELQFTTGNMRLDRFGDFPVTRARGDFDYAPDNPDIFPDDYNVQVYTQKGEKKYSFSRKQDFNNGQMNVKGNEVYLDFDNSDNIVVVYTYRNLIEKYDPHGKIIWAKEQLLNFDATMPRNERDQSNTFEEVEMNLCHAGVAVDSIGRIWVVSLNRQLRPEEKVNTNLRIMRGFDGRKNLTISVSDYTGPTTVNVFKIDIFDPDGEFLSSIPLDHFADNIRISGNDLFIIDTFHDHQISHYKIMD